MNIDGVYNGIALDHIRAGHGMRIYRYLGLDKLDCCIAVIQNVRSSQLGKKDIIKIDSELELDLDALGYLEPDITVNYIRGGKVAEKRCLTPPAELRNVIFCKNPRCITSTERGIDHIFRLTDPEARTYRCAYCDADGPVEP